MNDIHIHDEKLNALKLALLRPERYNHEEFLLAITFTNAKIQRPPENVDALESIGIRKGDTIVVQGEYKGVKIPVYMSGKTADKFIDMLLLDDIENISTTVEMNLQLLYAKYINFSDFFIEPQTEELIVWQATEFKDVLSYFSNSFDSDDNEQA